MLMEYFRPIHIPTIDDVKSPDVTPEVIYSTTYNTLTAIDLLETLC